MAKKKNPTVSLRQSDINRMKEEITRDAINKAFILFFTVMHDKWGFGQKRLARMLRQIDELSKMVNQSPHYVTIERLRKSLREEIKIDIDLWFLILGKNGEQFARNLMYNSIVNKYHKRVFHNYLLSMWGHGFYFIFTVSLLLCKKREKNIGGEQQHAIRGCYIC